MKLEFISKRTRFVKNMKTFEFARHKLIFFALSRMTHCKIIGLCLGLFFFNNATKAQNCSINAGIDFTACANDLIYLQAFTAGPLNSSPSSSWTQISGPTATIVSAGSLKTQVKGFSRTGNTYKFVASINCQLGGVTRDTITITIKTTPNKPYAGPDTSFCPGTKQFNATPPASGETGQWYEFGVYNYYTGVNNNSQYNTTLNSYSKGSYSFYRWELKNTTTGCTDADTMFVTFCGGEKVNAGPDIFADSCYAGPSTSVLLAPYTFYYSGAVPSNMGQFCGQYGMWSTLSQPSSNPVPSISNAYSNTGVTVSNLYPGTYQFTWSVYGPCASGIDTVKVVVPKPLGRTLTPFGTKVLQLCGQQSAALVGPALLQSRQKFNNWSKAQGPAGDSIGSITSLSTNVYKLKLPVSNQYSTSYPYPYIYNYGVFDSVCNRNVNGQIYIYLQQNPSVSFASKSVSLACNSTSTSVKFTYKNVGWNWVLDRISGPSTYGYSFSIIDTVTGQLNLSSLSNGQYVFRIRSNQGGCASNIADLLQVNVYQSPSLSNAGSNQKLNCNVDSAFLVGNIPTIGTGKWYQISGPSTVSFLPNNSSNAVKIKNLQAGTYILRWTIDGGTCPSNYDDVLVHVVKAIPPYAEAGSAATICYGSPYALHGSAVQSTETGTWSVTPTGPSFSNKNDSVATVTGLAASTTYKFKWTVSNACGSIYDSVIITTGSNAGPIAANAGNDTCYTSGVKTITLNGNSPSPSGATGLWSAVGSFSGTITSSSSNTTTVTGLNDGQYRFVWALNIAGCSSTTDTINITIAKTASPVLISKDTSICASSLTLKARSANTGSGSWSQLNGPSPAIFSNATDTACGVSSLTTGSYTFRWKINNGTCPSASKNLNVMVSGNPSTPKAMNDTVFCGSGNLTYRTVQLKAIRPTSGTGRWSFLSGPSVYNIVPDTSITPGLVYLSQSGIFKFIWQVSTAGACAPKQDTVQITNVLTPNAGADQFLCNQTTTQLTGNYYSNGVWRQIGSSPTVATVTNMNGWTAAISNLSSGTYLFEYDLSQGSCTKKDTVKVVNSSPVGSVNAGNDTSVCLKDTNEITLKGSNVTAGAKAQWILFSYPYGYSPAYKGRTDTTNSPTLKNMNYKGQYLLKYQVSNGACYSEDNIQVTINQGFSISAIPDTSRCGGSDTFLLKATKRTATTYKWSLFSGGGNTPSTPDSSSTYVRLTKNNYFAAYLLKLKDLSSRCIYKDTVNIYHSEAPVCTILPSRDTICGNNPVNYKYFTALNNVPVQYTWQRNNTTNVTGIPATENLPYIGGYIANNKTSVNQMVVFTIQSSAPAPSGCVGNTFYDTLIVRPNVNYSLKLNVDTVIKCYKELVKTTWTNVSIAKYYCLSTKPDCGGTLLYQGKDTAFSFPADYDNMELFLTLVDSNGCKGESRNYFKIIDPGIYPKLDSKNYKLCYNDSTYIFEVNGNSGYFTFSSDYMGRGNVYYSGKDNYFFYKPDTFGINKKIYLMLDAGKGCPGIDSIEIVLFNSPRHTLVALQDTVCYGENIDFEIHLNDAANYYKNCDIGIGDYPFGNGNKFYYSSDTLATINSVDFINYGYPWGTKTPVYSWITDYSAGCIDTATTYITIAEIPVADAGPDIPVLNIYDSAQIGGSPTGSCTYCFGNLLYLWSPNDSLSSPYIPNPYTSTDSTHTYTVTVMDSIFGCKSSDEMNIIAILPIKWLSASGEWQNLFPKLAWTTTNIQNVMYFNILRSDGKTVFENTGKLNVNPIHKDIETFYFTDSSASDEQEIYYYKIEAIDMLNNKEQSDVIAVQKQIPVDLRISPNPCKDKINLSFYGNSGETEINLFDMTGKIVLSQNYEAKRGYNHVEILIPSNISEGIYLLQLNFKNQNQQEKSLLKIMH